MSKTFCWIFILIVFSSQVLAQDIRVDQQKMEAGSRKPDSTFVNYLLSTGLAYSKSITKNDSAEIFLLQASKFAAQINWYDGLFEAREALSQYYLVKGKLSQSLTILLQNERTAIEKEDSTTLFT